MEECLKCEKRLPVEQFSRDASRESSLSRYCKACCKLARQNPKPAGWVRKTSDMAAYDREYRKRIRAEHPEIAIARERKKYESKMRKLHGPEWAPARPKTDEEKAEAAKRRRKSSAESKKAKRLSDPQSKQAYDSRRKLKRAVSRGKIVPLPCEVCGEKAEAHHPSYDMPLVVVWLCREHHREAHAVTKDVV
jgi:hypothetical protein